jgi:hypothetical protein
LSPNQWDARLQTRRRGGTQKVLNPSASFFAFIAEAIVGWVVIIILFVYFLLRNVFLAELILDFFFCHRRDRHGTWWFPPVVILVVMTGSLATMVVTVILQ